MIHHLTGALDAKKSKKTLAALFEAHQSNPDEDWEIVISSPGGYIDATTAIYSELYSYSKRAGGSHFVITTVRGQAASGAALVFQAGDVRLMGRMDRLMIHEPRLTCDTMPLRDVKTFVNEYESWTDRSADIYLERSQLSRSEFLSCIGPDDWILYADEAIQNGFADSLG